ncbi:MAG: gamma-glutamyl-gamma-aminobutyrate hydrolase family protein [Candidatus Baltobacteraceae bacterium]|jgi:putative glutamine amidotransferase
MRPRIGISSSHPHLEDGKLHADVVRYAEAVSRAGGEPVLLENDAAACARILAGVDGILASGGCDVGVALYGGRPLPSVQEPDLARDAFELALLRAARAQGIPTLCICRGLQVANVAFGGTLIEDLPEELGASYTLHHRQTKEDGLERTEHAPEHVVTLEPHGALARLVGATSFATNSLHHQAVREPAPGLRVAGRTPDGVIEALDASFAHPFFFAVQWHPEELAGDPVSDALFAGLVRAAAGAVKAPVRSAGPEFR